MEEQYTGSTRIFSVERMMELLSQGVSPESADKDGKTFLRHACADGKSDIAKVLLDRGANANSRDNEGKTPLMSAAMTGRLEMVKLLLEQGADPTIETATGDSAIKIAQRWGKKDIIQILLDATEQGCTTQDRAHQQTTQAFSDGIRNHANCAPEKNFNTSPKPQELGATLLPKVPSVSSGVIETEAGSEAAPIPELSGDVNITRTAADVVAREPQLPSQNDFKIPEVTTDERKIAIKTMEESPDDRIGTLGTIGATVATAAGGAGIAAALGSGTAAVAVTAPVLGSVTLGGWLGAAATATAVVAAPVSLVIGGAVAAAALGYGVTRLIRSGAKEDEKKKRIVDQLKALVMEETEMCGQETNVSNEETKRLEESLQLLLKNNRISESDCTDLLAGVQSGILSYDFAFDTIEKISRQ